LGGGVTAQKVDPYTKEPWKVHTADDSPNSTDFETSCKYAFKGHACEPGLPDMAATFSLHGVNTPAAQYMAMAATRVG
jgi:hypothetical protein